MFVGSPTDSKLGKWTDAQVDNCVKAFAKTRELDNLIGVRSRAISRKLRAVQTMDDASAA